MIVDGIAYRLMTWERRTYATGGSSLPADLLPTLTAASYGTGGNGIRKGTQKQVLSVQTMARRGLLPTITVKGNYNKVGLSSRSGDGLITWLWKNGVAGQLNPDWADLYMGYPPGWTVCEAWAMPWFPRKRAKPSAA
jgi:hypothetical protein